MSVASWCSTCFGVVLCVSCTVHFVMVPFNMTCLHCLQHSFIEHLSNLYLIAENPNSAGNNTAITSPFIPGYINVALCLLMYAGVQNNVSVMETPI